MGIKDEKEVICDKLFLHLPNEKYRDLRARKVGDSSHC